MARPGPAHRTPAARKHVHGFLLDLCAVSARMLIVPIDVIDVDDKPRAGDIHRSRLGELVIGGHPVQPDGEGAGTNLGMNRLTLSIAIDTPASEPKRLDEEVVRRRDVFVDEDGDDAVDCGHRVLPSLTDNTQSHSW